MKLSICLAVAASMFIASAANAQAGFLDLSKKDGGATPETYGSSYGIMKDSWTPPSQTDSSGSSSSSDSSGAYSGSSAGESSGGSRVSQE